MRDAYGGRASEASRTRGALLTLVCLLTCACGAGDDEPREAAAGGTDGRDSSTLGGTGGGSGTSGGAAHAGTSASTDGTSGDDDDSSPVPTVSSCSSDGFCWLNPLPTGVDLTAVHGSSAKDVWAVGGLGYVLHWDGSEWRRVASPDPSVPLKAVWVFSPSDVWVAGGDRVNGVPSRAFHWDGADLTDFDTGNAEAGDLWASSPSDVWLRSWEGESLLHYDGTSWTERDPPTPERDSFDTFQVTSLWGSAVDDVWSVARNFSQDTWSVLRWDGSSWTPIELPSTVKSPVSLFGRSGHDVLLIADEESDGYLGLYAYDGRAWSRLADSPAVTEVALMGTSAGLRLGGGNGHAFLFQTLIDRTKPPALTPLAERTDDGFSAATVTAPDPQNLGPYAAVWSADTGEAWAVGESGAIGHRKDGSWVQVSSGDNEVSFRSGWGTQATSFLIGAEPNRILRYEDGVFSEAFAFQATSPKNIAIIGAEEGDIWAGVDGYERLLTHFDGRHFREQFKLGNAKLASDGNGAFHHAVPGWLFTTHDTVGCVMDSCDYGSGHLRTNGVTEEELPSCITGVRGSPGGVFASSPTDSWYLMTNQPTPLENVTNAVHVVDGTCVPTVLPVPPDTVTPQYAFLVGTSATDIWALGSAIAAHYDGSTWTASKTPFNPLRVVIGKSGLWTIAQASPEGVYHLANGEWSHVDTFGLDRNARAIWVSDDGAVLVAGDDGALLRRDATP